MQCLTHLVAFGREVLVGVGVGVGVDVNANVLVAVRVAAFKEAVGLTGKPVSVATAVKALPTVGKIFVATEVCVASIVILGLGLIIAGIKIIHNVINSRIAQTKRTILET